MAKQRKGGMISEDRSAPDMCPRHSIEKAYPSSEYNDMSYGADLYSGAEEGLRKNNKAMRREKSSDPQYY